MPVTVFTAMCRELDIGQRYKTYLEDNLSIGNPVDSALLRGKIRDSQKSAITAALHLAQMQKTWAATPTALFSACSTTCRSTSSHGAVMT